MFFKAMDLYMYEKLCESMRTYQLLSRNKWCRLTLGELGGCLGRWAKRDTKKEKYLSTWFRKWWPYTKKR